MAVKTMTFKPGDWVRTKLMHVINIDINNDIWVRDWDNKERRWSADEIDLILAPFLIEGRTYQCRKADLTATVSKNENGWWVGTCNDGMQGTISDRGYFLTVKESTRDLIALLPEEKICECCGKVVKEKE